MCSTILPQWICYLSVLQLIVSPVILQPYAEYLFWGVPSTLHVPNGIIEWLASDYIGFWTLTSDLLIQHWSNWTEWFISAFELLLRRSSVVEVDVVVSWDSWWWMICTLTCHFPSVAYAHGLPGLSIPVSGYAWAIVCLKLPSGWRQDRNVTVSSYQLNISNICALSAATPGLPSLK